jgi:hypothetical protein
MAQPPFLPGAALDAQFAALSAQVAAVRTEMATLRTELSQHVTDQIAAVSLELAAINQHLGLAGSVDVSLYRAVNHAKGRSSPFMARWWCSSCGLVAGRFVL